MIETVTDYLQAINNKIETWAVIQGYGLCMQLPIRSGIIPATFSSMNPILN